MFNIRSFYADMYLKKNQQACACHFFSTRHVGLWYISTKAFLSEGKICQQSIWWMRSIEWMETLPSGTSSMMDAFDFTTLFLREWCTILPPPCFGMDGDRHINCWLLPGCCQHNRYHGRPGDSSAFPASPSPRARSSMAWSPGKWSDTIPRLGFAQPL